MGGGRFRTGLSPDVEGPPEVRARLGAVPDPAPRGLVLRALRRVYRELGVPFVLVMLAGRRFGGWLLRTEFKVAGGCKKRGVCCQYILLGWGPWLERSRLLSWLVLFRLTRIHSFFDRGFTWELEDGVMARVLGCHALAEDGSCSEYRLRPLICRGYPSAPLLGRPMLHKGCGYHAVRRDGAPDVDVPIASLKRSPHAPRSPT